jgi:cytochrome c oxidase subunit 2
MVEADLERGRALYFTCSTCHGAEGQGRWGTNAPRLAGMNDWYLERQLQYFKSGIRGGHPDDIYGDQMNLVANVLVGENAIRDVVAYINTLRSPDARPGN